MILFFLFKYIYLFFLGCWPLLKGTRAASPSQPVDRLLAPHPGPNHTGKGFGFSAVKAALLVKARMSPLGQEPVPAAGTEGGAQHAGTGKTGAVFGAEGC